MNGEKQPVPFLDILTKQANGELFMVIPQDVERYSVQEGMRISAASLTSNKTESFYKHPKIWIIRIQKNAMETAARMRTG
jgi:hypothetical protein